MSVSLWRWSEECEGKPCPGDCDECGERDDEMGETTRTVERHEWLTVETLSEHLKTIGNAIKTDADAIGHFADGGQSIKIEAEVNPGEAVTMVKYTVMRYADPRTRAANKVGEDDDDSD